MKTQPSKSLLRSIARRAMLQRGLLPDFSPAVMAETASIAQAAAQTGAAIRDLRELLWASIDNDDSRDLDQLSVAEPLAGGAVKILVAIADVDAHGQEGLARSTSMRAPTPPRSTRLPRSSRCCPRSSRPTSHPWARSRTA